MNTTTPDPLNYLIVIKGEKINQIPSTRTFEDMKADLLGKGYLMHKVERRESLLSFMHPEKQVTNSDTLFLFNWRKNLSKILPL
jgi:hypothetical protein